MAERMKKPEVAEVISKLHERAQCPREKFDLDIAFAAFLRVHPCDKYLFNYGEGFIPEGEGLVE